METIHTANIDKIKSLARQRGIKIKFICSELGLAETYLSNCKNGKDRMTDERLYKIASILGTTYEYLTDQTESPQPTLEQLADMTESTIERIQIEVLDKLTSLSEDRQQTLLRLFQLPDDEFDRALEMLELLWR